MQRIQCAVSSLGVSNQSIEEIHPGSCQSNDNHVTDPGTLKHVKAAQFLAGNAWHGFSFLRK